VPPLPEVIDAYLAGPRDLRQLVTGLTREQFQARPVPGRWSTLEVVCHLADSEQAWVHRMKRVLAEERPLLIGYAESRFAAALGYQGRDPEDELALLEDMRKQMAGILRGLPEGAPARTGVHSERGLLTLGQMLLAEVEHVPHHRRFIREKRRALGAPAEG
jgi:DinB superfamily